MTSKIELPGPCSAGAAVRHVGPRALGLLAPVLLAAAPAQAETPVEAVNFELGEIVATPATPDDSQAEDEAGRFFRLRQDTVDGSGDSSQDPYGEQRLLPGRDPRARLTFGQHVESIKWELGAAFAYMTAVNMVKMATRPGGFERFSFHDEGFFGKDTERLGVDKLTHAHNTHILTDVLAARIRSKTGTSHGTALTGAVLASGLMLYSEVYDGFKNGFGVHDLVFNSLGAGFSVLRDTTPGLEEKLDFRVLVIPNKNIYSPSGAEHYEQLRYLFALKAAGFAELRDTPLRYLELHAGYHATGLSDDPEATQNRSRKLFAGVGINISEILFGRSPRSKAGRAGQELLDYWQPPYTYLHAK